MSQKYIEIDADLLLLAANGGDRNRTEVARRLREMTRDERAVLRDAIQRLDSALDEVVIEERLAKIETKDGLKK